MTAPTDVHRTGTPHRDAPATGGLASPADVTRARRTPVLRVVAESTDLALRNLLHLRRTPGLLISCLVEPVVYALLIGYIFGNSLGGTAYRSYMFAGLIAQTVAFTTTFTTVGLSRDLDQGMVDRFRTLPISRVALLLGRTASDLTTCVASLAVTTTCGLLMGWRTHTGPVQVAAGILLVLLFSFAMSWIGVFVALVSPNSQVAGSLGVIWLFPATFISSGFVSGATLPGPLSTVAAWNPITSLANALRELFGNPPPPGFSVQHGWPALHPELYTVGCSVLIIAVFTSLSTWRHHTRTSR
ncbi:ABC transporter permease [Streptomyces sp. WI04-05B]|uniref:ABC transporter permease n=1 Tax=Streptomyces TaxID=1883 RepID=UPI0029AB6874|nr:MULTISPECIES: ABC transporter permease [unclassified Streptomyces]MDX2546324.1 ABC transporter permease [Streptomyces sp. WI04-05B]MDX2589223.1 ABC transporter permease [Streptomyces sp. WI04-05A]MDX3748775.1 ABC transporter permease [Streptomyces sp. AK08-02]